MTTENLNDFLEKSSDTPMETFDQNGDIITFETCVLYKWDTDFENLYRTDDNSAFDSHFQNEALSHKQLREENMDHGYPVGLSFIPWQLTAGYMLDQR